MIDLQINGTPLGEFVRKHKFYINYLLCRIESVFEFVVYVEKSKIKL